MTTSTPRNSLCPCGSGLKYKRCCEKTGGLDTAQKARKARIVGTVFAICALVAGWKFGRPTGLVVAGCGVLLLGVYLYIFDDPPPPSQGGDPGAINFGR